MTTPPRPRAAKAASTTVIASRLILTRARSVVSSSTTTSMLIAFRSSDGRGRQKPLATLAAQLVRHLVDGALGDRHDLLDLRRRHDEGRREAQDVAVRHGARDQPLFEGCRRDTEAYLERGIEALLLALVGHELERRHQAHAPDLAHQRMVGERFAQAGLEMGARAGRVAGQVLALDDVEDGVGGG